jgi:hypothetical protein
VELLLTGRRAERVDALLRGARPAGTPEDARLLAAAAALGAWPPPEMRPDFRAALRARLLDEGLDAGPDGATDPDSVIDRTRTTARRRRVRRFARPALAGALATSVAAAGVVVWAGDAKPGDALYGVKRQVEQIEVTLTADEMRRAQARLDLARTRMKEMRALVAESGPADDEGLLGLLRAWRDEADLGSGVLLERAMAGDAGARSAVATFAAEQSGELVELIRALPEHDACRVAATNALDFIKEVDADLWIAGRGGPGYPAPASPGPAAPGSPAATATGTADGEAPAPPAASAPPTGSPPGADAAPGTPPPVSSPAPAPPVPTPSLPDVPALPSPPSLPPLAPQVPPIPSLLGTPGLRTAPDGSGGRPTRGAS